MDHDQTNAPSRRAPPRCRHGRCGDRRTCCIRSTAASAPYRGHAPTAEVRVVTLPIANGLPLDLGIRKGFFAQQGIEIKKTTLQSGNDVVLALANGNGDIGYLGFVPMFIAVTSNIPMTLVAASEVEGTSAADNWQNILVKGNSSIRTPRDLAGKTIAVNALKGVGEVMIKAAMEKLGVRPNAFRLTALPFPQMRSALNNGQVDAIWTPEPFLSQALNIDNARIVMAPGPVMGRYRPIGGYAARQSWRAQNPALAARFRTAINRALTYAQSHPDEIRQMLPPGTQNVRLPIWSPVVDRGKLQTLANYARKYGVITRMPNMRQLVPEQHRQRARPARHGAGPARAAATRRQHGDEADGGPVHLRRHRQLADAELHAKGTGREQADERPKGVGAARGR